MNYIFQTAYLSCTHTFAYTSQDTGTHMQLEHASQYLVCSYLLVHEYFGGENVVLDVSLDTKKARILSAIT